MSLPLFDLQPVPRVPSHFVREQQRRESNKDRVLARLRISPASNVELMALGGIRFSGRISDLRTEGYVITAQDCGGGLFRYTLVSQPVELSGNGRANS